MGRPRVDDKDKRTVQVNIRLTKEENDKIEQYAQNSGLSPANWIRKKIFTGKFPPVKLSALDASIYIELKKIGVNINQATHKLNSGEYPKDYLALQLKLQMQLNRIIKALVDDGSTDQG